ncbi:hypothetical protein [Streptomyces syringium]|uniref:hypothetical protein n=1 Tax=Streptomyces syringium TaxID=76729 RepID=UPI0033D998B0
MKDLCDFYLMSWVGWQRGMKITPDMELSLKDLARRGSTVREEAKMLLRAIDSSKIKIEPGVDPIIKETLDLGLTLSRLQLSSACDRASVNQAQGQ